MMLLLKESQKNMPSICACLGLNTGLFYSLLLVEPSNVSSKHWPKEYKLAEFSHHSEQKVAHASFS